MHQRDGTSWRTWLEPQARMLNDYQRIDLITGNGTVAALDDGTEALDSRIPLTNVLIFFATSPSDRTTLVDQQ